MRSAWSLIVALAVVLCAAALPSRKKESAPRVRAARATTAPGPATVTADTHTPTVAGPAAYAMAPRLVEPRLNAHDCVVAARVIAHEDSRPLRGFRDGGTEGALTIDAYAILQTVSDFARWTGRSDADSLRALAPHVSGKRPALFRRHAVYRGLPAKGLGQPAAWRTAFDGDWGDYAGNWATFRAGVCDVVHIGFPAPCTETVAWGNSLDDPIARSRGLVRAKCAGITINRFWGRP